MASNTAANIRKHKKAHPADYCANPRCLGHDLRPCPNHPDLLIERAAPARTYEAGILAERLAVVLWLRDSAAMEDTRNAYSEGKADAYENAAQTIEHGAHTERLHGTHPPSAHCSRCDRERAQNAAHETRPTEAR